MDRKSINYFSMIANNFKLNEHVTEPPYNTCK